ncbi:MAG: hypothetical protein WC604_02160 [Candidatus Gracilibacteria bacterium]
MTNFGIKKEKGSIALISLIVISAFTLILAVKMTESGISTGYQHVNNVAGQTSYYGAEGCFEEALIKIEDDTSFVGETVNFSSGSCVITVSGVNPKTVDVVLTQGDYQQTFRGVVGVAENGHAINASLSSWEEI